MAKLTAQYDGDGLRTTKTDAWTGQHDYTWGFGGLTYDSGGGGTAYTGGFGERKGTTDQFSHNDWKGSARHFGSGGTYNKSLRYDSWGNKTAASGTDWHPSEKLHAGGGTTRARAASHRVQPSRC